MDRGREHDRKYEVHFFRFFKENYFEKPPNFLFLIFLVVKNINLTISFEYEQLVSNIILNIILLYT